ncbi:AMP-binding protein [Oleiagrimonas sp. C23AA]|uniref:AMP-binding protein n=1 Tax=Oleiagrimonas sp. C23AA TaxID=2719047 RepID=UPI001422B5EF|nr:AMP-binding protein [Oleiagrimonas sp. C23AA]NII10836.1 AMP-binding protein [Oleiagrimonas sp. C23AA]
MAKVYESPQQTAALKSLPLLEASDSARTVAWHRGQAVSAARFLAHVEAVAAQLPEARHAVNLCADRYAFLVAFCAILRAGQTNLLPPSRAPQAVDEVMAAHPGSYALGEATLEPAPSGYVHLPELADPPEAMRPVAVPMIDAAHVAAIGYTSGSTGRPKPNIKTWGSFHASNRGNLAPLGAAVQGDFHMVATVPPQHMYGMETSVLLPLLGPASVHAERPFFPADVARALAEVPAPRVLVITPVHLRALVQADVELPPLAAMVSATAPMPVELAAQAEAMFGAPLVEMFGSTETCVFASRRAALGEDWAMYPGVRLHPQPDGTLIEAPQLAEPMVLADLVELRGEGHFRLCGRNTDLLEIAGKRASLADLNRRLLAIPGVEDGLVLQLDGADPMGVRRIAALVVAPELTEAQVMAALRRAMDPVFLPRPLRRVPSLPRNETGKLPRQQALALLKRML